MSRDEDDTLATGLALLEEGLQAYAEPRCREIFGQEWRKAATQALRQDGNATPGLDGVGLLRLLAGPWRTSFGADLTEADAALAVELQDAYARRQAGEQRSAEDSYRILDSATRLLTACNVPQVAALRTLTMGAMHIVAARQVEDAHHALVTLGATVDEDLGEDMPGHRAIDPGGWLRNAGHAAAIRTGEAVAGARQLRGEGLDGLRYRIGRVRLPNVREMSREDLIRAIDALSRAIELLEQGLALSPVDLPIPYMRRVFFLRQALGLLQKALDRNHTTAPGVPAFAVIWVRIRAHSGATFHLTGGRPFTYRVDGNKLIPSGVKLKIDRSHFERAHGRLPLANTTAVSDLFAPSYLYAILMDRRIREENW